MNLINTIEENNLLYSGAKSEIGKFILDKREEITTYTVEEIANQTFTSKASVVRFAKDLGFNGWREFVNQFLLAVKYQNDHVGEIDPNIPFTETSSANEVINNLKILQSESFDLTINLNHRSDFEKSSNLLENSKQLVIFASDPNNFLAESFRRKLLTIGYETKVVSEGEMGLEVGILNQEDCVLIISYSGGENSTAVRHLGLLKTLHIPVIAITSDNENYLGKNADIVLRIPADEHLYTKIASFQSESAITFILDILYSLIYQKHYQKNTNYKIDTGRYIEADRTNNFLKK